LTEASSTPDVLFQKLKTYKYLLFDLSSVDNTVN